MSLALVQLASGTVGWNSCSREWIESRQMTAHFCRAAVLHVIVEELAVPEKADGLSFALAYVVIPLGWKQRVAMACCLISL